MMMVMSYLYYLLAVLHRVSLSLSLRSFEFLDGILQGLPLVAEPDSYHFPVVVQLLGHGGHFRARRVGVFVKHSVQVL